jgi:hypothetical protein
MEDYKQYLSADADDLDREAAQKVMEGLSGLRLERKVKEVALERQALLRRRFWGGVVLALLLAVIGSVAVLYFWRKSNQTKPQEYPKQIEQIIPQQVTPIQEKSNEIQPIAKRTITPQEQAAQPLLRSIQPDLDSATNHLIGILLEISEHNEASQKLETRASKACWADAIRLLKKNMPIKAKSYIFKLSDNSEASKMMAQWLLAISMLEEGKLEDAESIFSKIAQTPQHPFYRDAQSAKEALL